jgi:hypothetical protein
MVVPVDVYGAAMPMRVDVIVVMVVFRAVFMGPPVDATFMAVLMIVSVVLFVVVIVISEPSAVAIAESAFRS